jgi:hypothetical protein
MMTKSVIRVMTTVQEETQTTVPIGFSTVVPHLAVNSTMIVKHVLTNHSVDTVPMMTLVKKVTATDPLMVTVTTGSSIPMTARHPQRRAPQALADETLPLADETLPLADDQPQALAVDLPPADEDLPLEDDQPQVDEELPLEELLEVEVLPVLHRWSLPQLHLPSLLPSLLYSTFKQSVFCKRTSHVF